MHRDPTPAYAASQIFNFAIVSPEEPPERLDTAGWPKLINKNERPRWLKMGIPEKY